MRVNQTAIGDYFLGLKTVDEVIGGYRENGEIKGAVETELKKMLEKDLGRFQKGVEIYTYECDRRYSRFLNTKGFDLPIVR